jgi:hypothetical protein
MNIFGVTPLQRAYQLTVLGNSRCPGCRNCAQMLMEHPDAVTLTCHVCDSGFEPGRPWASVTFTSAKRDDP